MMPGVDGLEAAVIDVRVDLRRANIGVAEQFLERPDFGSAGEHVRRETMTKCVGTDMLARPNPGRIAFDENPDHFAGEASTAATDEDVLGVFAGEPGAFMIKVGFQGGERHRIERNDAFLVAFPHNTTEAFLQIDRGERQSDHLAGPAAGGVHHREQRPIAEGVAIGPRRRDEQAIDRVGAENGGELLPEFGGIDEFGGALGNDRFEQEIAKEGFERDEMTGDGGWLEPGGVQMVKITRECL